MARTPAQRGRTGTWLVQARLARGYDTQAVARREIERLTGWRIPQSQYAEWESGRRVPSDAALERLQAFYGTPDEQAVIGTDASSIVAAIDRLTEAVRAQGQQQVDGMTALAEVLGVVLSRLGGLPERTPDGSAGQSVEAGSR